MEGLGLYTLNAPLPLLSHYQNNNLLSYIYIVRRIKAI